MPPAGKQVASLPACQACLTDYLLPLPLPLRPPLPQLTARAGTGRGPMRSRGKLATFASFALLSLCWQNGARKFAWPRRRLSVAI